MQNHTILEHLPCWPCCPSTYTFSRAHGFDHVLASACGIRPYRAVRASRLVGALRRSGGKKIMQRPAMHDSRTFQEARCHDVATVRIRVCDSDLGSLRSVGEQSGGGVERGIAPCASPASECVRACATGDGLVPRRSGPAGRRLRRHGAQHRRPLGPVEHDFPQHHSCSSLAWLRMSGDGDIARAFCLSKMSRSGAAVDHVAEAMSSTSPLATTSSASRPVA